MDFIDGQTLAEILWQTSGQKLTVEEVLFIAEQLCSVLGYLHARQPSIIFRDMKPANVMMTLNKDHLYLIDFGIARFFKPGQLRDTLAFGTAGYAPPEQYGGQTTERSDIYSLGATLHQLLTGLDPSRLKIPFSFPSIRAANPQTPPLLEELIMQMVQYDPVKRPASTLAIKRELQLVKHALQQMPLTQNVRNLKEITSPTITVMSKPRKETTLYVYRKHTDSVHGVTWAPDGKHIASCGRDKTVHVLNTAAGDNILIYKNHLSYVYAVAWSPDGTRIASTSFGNVHVWDVTNSNNCTFYHGHSFWVYAVAWSPGGMHLVTGGADGEAHLWDACTGDIICRYQGFSRVVKAIAWSSATSVVCGCEDTTLCSWDTATESTPVFYQGHKREVSSVAWSPDNTKIVSASGDKTVKIWGTNTGNTLYTYQGHAKEVYAVAWSPDGSRIASAGEDKTVHVWDAFTGNTLYIYQGHTKEVYAVAWSPDGSRIASAGEDKTVHVWQAL